MRNRYDQSTIDAIRKTIAAEALDPENHDARSLANSVNRLAEAEGYVYADAVIDYALAHENGGVQAARDEAMDLLARGADDSWSGRANDNRRAYFDGVREAVRDRRYADLRVPRGE